MYEGTAEEGAAPAAIKVIDVSRPKKRARFIQEVKSHVSLSEAKAANIIPVLDYSLEELTEPNGGVKGYIAMPMAVGSLHDFSESYVHRTELCLETFLGITRGIEQAHNKGVIHRDIKPANIQFLESSLKDPMVSDFGICYLKETSDAERITELGETVGARFFMAPEQEQGGATEVGFPADLYALGKLLHYMITGRTLSREKLSEAFSDAELHEDPRLKIIHDQILSRTILEDPARRVQTAGELLAVASEILKSIRRSVAQ